MSRERERDYLFQRGGVWWLKLQTSPEMERMFRFNEGITIANDYGEGFPVPVLKEWIDKIGL